MCENKIIVSCHQPNFIPYLGFFDKMYHSDIIILLDAVQYTKNGYCNRNRIIDGRWLTIPIQKHPLNTPINQIKVSIENWKTRHFNILKYYNSTQILARYLDIYQLDSQLLVDYTINSIKFIQNTFNINTKIILQSEIMGSLEYRGTEMLLQLVKKVGGSHYLSGLGALLDTKSGPAYLNLKSFSEIKLLTINGMYESNFSSLDFILRNITPNFLINSSPILSYH